MDPNRHAGLVARRLEPSIRDASLVIVQGDTSSALGGALGAELAGVPLAHVEAGLRSHDRSHPWPEEDFRIAIDARADLLFAPTELNAVNLRREGILGEIQVTGNTGIDALLNRLPMLRQEMKRRDGTRQLLVTCHRRESWGEGLEVIASCLRHIASRPDVSITMVLHPNPAVACEMHRLLSGAPGVILHEPCAPLQMLQLMRSSDLILSDSGGIQEEAPALGIPLLILRDRTERPEGILSGNSILLGRDPVVICATVDRLLSDNAAFAQMSRPSLPFGDGRASSRIAAAIEDYLRRNCPEAEMVTPTGLEPVFSP